MNENRDTNTPADLESVAKDALAKTIKDKWNYKAVCIHCHSVRKRLADYDGVSVKAALDGIVEAGVLIDDNLETVKEVTQSQEKGKEEKTIITIKEAE